MAGTEWRSALIAVCRAKQSVAHVQQHRCALWSTGPPDSPARRNVRMFSPPKYGHTRQHLERDKGASGSVITTVFLFRMF